MNRREFMQCTAILASGISAAQMGWAITEEQTQHLSMAPNYMARKVEYFSDVQRKTVAAIAETIIPRTETPGAIDAGVPHYIELMVAEWFNDQEREIFDAGLVMLMTSTQAEYGKAFEELPERVRIEVLEALEEDASDASWYGFSATLPGDFDSDNPFICQLKELTVWGFFTSEIGATQVLRHDPMPMKFEGSIPLGPDDSSWSGGLL